jgi:hypothetical protein
VSAANLAWDADVEIAGTSFRGFLSLGELGFQETVARLITLSGQTPVGSGDGKTTVEFAGTFRGKAFSLYDYRGDQELHIGGGPALNVDALREALTAALKGVQPTPYICTDTGHYYDNAHQWDWPTEKPVPATSKYVDIRGIRVMVDVPGDPVPQPGTFLGNMPDPESGCGYVQVVALDEKGLEPYHLRAFHPSRVKEL